MKERKKHVKGRGSYKKREEKERKKGRWNILTRKKSQEEGEQKGA